MTETEHRAMDRVVYDELHGVCTDLHHLAEDAKWIDDHIDAFRSDCYRIREEIDKVREQIAANGAPIAEPISDYQRTEYVIAQAANIVGTELAYITDAEPPYESTRAAFVDIQENTKQAREAFGEVESWAGCNNPAFGVGAALIVYEAVIDTITKLASVAACAKKYLRDLQNGKVTHDVAE